MKYLVFFFQTAAVEYPDHRVQKKKKKKKDDFWLEVSLLMLCLENFLLH